MGEVEGPHAASEQQYALSAGFVASPVAGRFEGPQELQQIEVLISCGRDMRRLRSAAGRTLDRFNHFLRYQRAARYVITQWNYMFDPSRVVAPGHLADRSVQAVDESEGVIAIVGDYVPSTTRREIRHVYELRDLGLWRELWFLRLEQTKTSGAASTPAPGSIALDTFVDELRADFGIEPVYHPVAGQTDFVASLIFEMLPFVIQRTGAAFGPIGTGASS